MSAPNTNIDMRQTWKIKYTNATFFVIRISRVLFVSKYSLSEVDSKVNVRAVVIDIKAHLVPVISSRLFAFYIWQSFVKFSMCIIVNHLIRGRTCYAELFHAKLGLSVVKRRKIKGAFCLKWDYCSSEYFICIMTL